MRFLAFPSTLVAVVAALVSSGFLQPQAQADPAKVYLLGLHSGCERLSSLERTLERRLYEKGLGVHRLDVGETSKPASCAGIDCARRFTSQCPGVSGRLLWGQAVPGRNVTKTRLFLYDLATQQVAVQDDWCQGCDAASAVTAHAEQLLRAPRFSSTAPSGPVPMYCSPASGVAPSAALASPAAAPLFLTVYGEGKQRGALLSGLRQQLTLLGRRLLPVAGEPGKYSSDVLRKLVAGQSGAQVLGAEAQKDGSTLLFLYDGTADQTDGKTVTCTDCEREQHIAQVKQAVAELLEKCFGERCSPGSGSKPAPVAGAAPPPEACEPFSDSACGAPPPPGTLPPRHIDPTTARLVKGVLWGLVGTSAATAIGLAIANTTSAGTSYGRIEQTDNVLGPAALAATGLSVLTLALAIPVTIAVQRGSGANQIPAATNPADAPLQCPN